MDPILTVPVVVLLLTLSAFFSSTEIALFSLPVERVEALAREAGVRGSTLKRLRDDPHRLLVGILVGNNVVNVAISSLVTLLVASYLPAGQTVAAATAVTSVVVLLFGEILPKAYGLGNAESWGLRAARPLTVIMTVLYPVIVVFDAVTSGFSKLVGADPEIEKEVLDEKS